MILEVSFCGHLAPLLFNPSVRQNTMLESPWWSKAVYLTPARRAGEEGAEREGCGEGSRQRDIQTETLE